MNLCVFSFNSSLKEGCVSRNRYRLSKPFFHLSLKCFDLVFFFSVTFDFITSCHCLHAWKTTPITFIICVLMLSSRTNRLCSQTNLPQKSPLASNPTSERLWCCHLVGSPSKKTERSQRKGERRERREGEKEKQRICHD